MIDQPLPSLDAWVERLGQLPIPVLRRTARELDELRSRSDESGRLSYRVEWEERSDRLAGNQRLPRRIYFADAASFLGFLGKNDQARRFREDVGVILAHVQHCGC